MRLRVVKRTGVDYVPTPSRSFAARSVPRYHPSILRLRLPVHLPRKSSKCPVLSMHRQDYRLPIYRLRLRPQLNHHDHANARSRERGLVWPIFSIDQTIPTTVTDTSEPSPGRWKAPVVPTAIVSSLGFTLGSTNVFDLGGADESDFCGGRSLKL